MMLKQYKSNMYSLFFTDLDWFWISLYVDPATFVSKLPLLVVSKDLFDNINYLTCEMSIQGKSKRKEVLSISN